VQGNEVGVVGEEVGGAGLEREEGKGAVEEVRQAGTGGERPEPKGGGDAEIIDGHFGLSSVLATIS
jgi:hypothetical protein